MLLGPRSKARARVELTSGHAGVAAEADEWRCNMQRRQPATVQKEQARAWLRLSKAVDRGERSAGLRFDQFYSGTAGMGTSAERSPPSAPRRQSRSNLL